jgi:hypothetical protein
MSVYEIDPIKDPKWAEFLKEQPAASVFHSVSWLQALQRTYGYHPFVVTTCKPEKALTNGIVACRVKSKITGTRLISLPFSDYCQPLVDDAGDMHELIEHLKVQSEVQKCKYLELRPTKSNAALLGQSGFHASQHFCIHKLNVELDEDEIFQSFHKSCVRRKIGSAEKRGLITTEGNSEEFVNAFYALLLKTRRRHQLPPQPLKWFQNLAYCFGERLVIRIALTNDTPIAGILTLVEPRCVVYKYGASDSTFHNLGGMPLLFWRAIQDAKVRGATEFDFGRSDLDNAGLIAFKDHWGGVRSSLTYFRYPDIAAEHGTWRVNLARTIFSLLPDSCLAAAGNLLYKHVG